MRIEVDCERIRANAAAVVTVVGASSDVLVLDVTEADPPVALGEELAFDTLYPAVSSGWASPFTTRVVRST